jgi:hypothetical protein
LPLFADVFVFAALLFAELPHPTSRVRVNTAAIAASFLM